MPGILLATKGADTSDAAASIAARLASQNNTILSAVCVVEPPLVVDGGFAAWYVPTLEENEAVHLSLRAAVSAQLRRCDASAQVHVQVRTGPPASEIASAARETGAEIIVLGLGRHDFLDRALGDETALQLVQQAVTPVLAVPPGMTAMPRRAVVAIDFSPTSIASAKACALWLVKGGTIHLVYVAGEWHGGYPAEQRASAEGALAAIGQHLDAPQGTNVEQSVVEGETADQLLKLAANSGADVIVLGSHGYGLWKRLTIGSVASKIIRLSPTAVFVTPVGCLPPSGVATTTDAARAARN